MKKNVTLVLSGGGARGFAHIGAIEEIESRGYIINSIAGISMGALIGGVYATGKLNEFKEWAYPHQKREKDMICTLKRSLNLKKVYLKQILRIRE